MKHQTHRHEFVRILHLTNANHKLNKVDVSKSDIIAVDKNILSLKWEEVKKKNILLVPPEVYEFFKYK